MKIRILDINRPKDGYVLLETNDHSDFISIKVIGNPVITKKDLQHAINKLKIINNNPPYPFDGLLMQ